MNNQQYHEQVANEIIDMLKNGNAPWQQCWANGDLPMNGNTHRRYRGMNALYLYKKMQDKGYQDSRWYTFKQINAMGGKINKGEKGCQVEYWKFTETYKDDKGEEHEVPLDHPVPFRHTVFNAEQATGIPEYKKQEFHWEPMERAEKLLQAVGTPIYHDQVDQNFYNSHTDSIHLTPKTSFMTEEGYYSTALHELGHSTGHSSRLDRQMSAGFGTPEYAREELRAEIASFMLCKDLGLEEDQKHKEQHAAYVGSWIQALQKDHNEIFRAAADAERICDFIYEKEKLLNKEQEKALVMEGQSDFGKEKAGQVQEKSGISSKIDEAIQGQKELAVIQDKVNKIAEKVGNAFAKMGSIINGEKNSEGKSAEDTQRQEKTHEPVGEKKKENQSTANHDEKKQQGEKTQDKGVTVVPPTVKQVYFLKSHQMDIPASKTLASVVIGREIKLNEIRSFTEPKRQMNVMETYRSIAHDQLEKKKGINDTDIAKTLLMRGFGKNDVQRAIYSCSPANSHSNAINSTKAALDSLKKENIKVATQCRER